MGSAISVDYDWNGRDRILLAFVGDNYRHIWHYPRLEANLLMGPGNRKWPYQNTVAQAIFSPATTQNGGFFFVMESRNNSNGVDVVISDY